MDVQRPVPTPFGASSTTDEVIEGIDLAGKLAVVTGGSVGLGKETARALASAGADVFLGARSLDALEQARTELQAIGAGQIGMARLDLSDAASVKHFADAVIALGRPVDLLINNAGIMACPEGRDARGNESQLSTNYLGHALLTSLLAPSLVAANDARLISLSSVGHHWSPIDFDDVNFERRDYDQWRAYGQSKTANALLARKVADALGDVGVKAFAVHPGLIVTDLGRFMTPEDRERTARELKDYQQFMQPFKSVASGAATTVWAATSPLLEDRDFAYLEDCKVAEIQDKPNFGFGVMRYAIDSEQAAKMWTEAEKLLGQPLPL